MKRNILMKLLRYEIPDEYQNRSNTILCHYCNWFYAVMMLLCVVLGLVFAIGMTYGVLCDANEVGDYMTAVMIVGVGVCSVGLGWLFGCYMKHWTLIFHENGIWYRSMTGKIYQYSDEEILGYVITNAPKHHYITLRTKNKRIWVDSNSKNYIEAKALVQKKYPSL
ncbi:MAG: hypothetical protein IJA10_09885 [Lachnospiraceae bacterium]|nr:hypothetical protein [Lachnospiraceae bacterium]